MQMIENTHQRPVLISKREGGTFSQKRKPGKYRVSGFVPTLRDASPECQKVSGLVPTPRTPRHLSSLVTRHSSLPFNRYTLQIEILLNYTKQRTAIKFNRYTFTVLNSHDEDHHRALPDQER